MRTQYRRKPTTNAATLMKVTLLLVLYASPARGVPPSPVEVLEEGRCKPGACADFDS